MLLPNMGVVTLYRRETAGIVAGLAGVTLLVGAKPAVLVGLAGAATFMYLHVRRRPWLNRGHRAGSEGYDGAWGLLLRAVAMLSSVSLFPFTAAQHHPCAAWQPSRKPRCLPAPHLRNPQLPRHSLSLVPNLWEVGAIAVWTLLQRIVNGSSADACDSALRAVLPCLRTYESRQGAVGAPSSAQQHAASPHATRRSCRGCAGCRVHCCTSCAIQAMGRAACTSRPLVTCHSLGVGV
jgi:hypothetical protein